MIRPLQDRVIVKRIEEEEKSKGGIIIPDTAQDSGGAGYILMIGDEVGFDTSSYYDAFPFFQKAVKRAKREGLSDEEFDTLVEHGQTNLLGRHIVYGKYTSKSIRMDVQDRDFETTFAMIHAKDVWLFQNDEDRWVIPTKEEQAIG